MRFGQTAPVANPHLPANHPLNVAARNAAALAASAPAPQPGAQGSGIAVPSDDKNRFWFTYQTTNIATLAPLGTTTNTILFDNDSVFQWTKLTATADDGSTTTNITNSSIVVPLVTVQILDTGTGAYYSNAQIPLEAYAGNWGLPYVLPAPQFISPNASLQFNFTSYQASGGITYNNLRLQLHGFKIKMR